VLHGCRTRPAFHTPESSATTSQSFLPGVACVPPLAESDEEGEVAPPPPVPDPAASPIGPFTAGSVLASLLQARPTEMAGLHLACAAKVAAACTERHQQPQGLPHSAFVTVLVAQCLTLQVPPCRRWAVAPNPRRLGLRR
jgi:hypothetical protein